MIVDKDNLIFFIRSMATSGTIPALTIAQAESIRWARNGQGMVSDTDQAIITLSLRSYTQRGTDEHRRTFTPDVTPEDSTFETAEYGAREVTLTMKCEAYDYNVEASEILDAIRVQFGVQDFVDALNSINLSMADAIISSDLPTTYDNRVVSVAVMDVRMNAIAGFSNVQTGQGWIDSVNTDNIIPAEPPLS